MVERSYGYLELIEAGIIILAIGIATFMILAAMMAPVQARMEYSIAIAGAGDASIELSDSLKIVDSATGAKVLYDTKAALWNAEGVTMMRTITRDGVTLTTSTNLSRDASAPGRMISGGVYRTNIGMAIERTNESCKYLVSGIRGEAMQGFNVEEAMNIDATGMAHMYKLSGEAGSASSGIRTNLEEVMQTVTASGRYAMQGAVDWHVPATVAITPVREPGNGIGRLCVWQLENGEGGGADIFPWE